MSRPPKPLLHVAQDSREQCGLDPVFARLRVEVIPDVTLPTFDYALAIPCAGRHLPLSNGRTLEGYRLDDEFAVERKSAADLVAAITTTEGMRREREKCARAAWAPKVYVVEGSMWDALPTQPCWCRHEPGGPPNRACRVCGGRGYVGCDYGRRRVVPAFTIHQLVTMMMEWGATPLFCGDRVAAACLIEALLRRRWEQITREARRTGR